MARQVIGENPLDLIVPARSTTTGFGPEPDDRAGDTAVDQSTEREDGAALAAAAPPDALASTATSRPGAPPGQYLTFLLGLDEYALHIDRVLEIVEYPAVTRVPATPAWIRGVVNLRGVVIPVLDLAPRFDLPESPQTKRTCLILVEVGLDRGVAVMGMVADAVHQVVDLDESAIEEPPSFGTRIHLDYLLGVGKTSGGLLLILDIDRVLSVHELRLAAGLESPANLATPWRPEPPGREEE